MNAAARNSKDVETCMALISLLIEVTVTDRSAVHCPIFFLLFNIIQYK